MLTRQEMRSAHFTRCLDIDPNFNREPENRRGRAYAASMDVVGSRGDRYRYATEMQRKYDSGRRVLKAYVLTYSPPYKRHAPVLLPIRTICSLMVDGGGTTTSEVRRMALFSKRKTGG